MDKSLTEYMLFHLLVLVTIIYGKSTQNSEPDRYDLIHYLLDEHRFDPSLPPDYYSENITTASLGLSIYDVNSENDMEMELECTFYLMMKWTDKRLDFSENISSYDSLSLGDETVDKMWIPDLYFHHESQAEMHGLFTKNQLLKLYRNGSIYYSSRINMKTHCDMDLTHYPFDRHTCPIRIQSYSLSNDNLLLRWDGDKGLEITETDKLKIIENSQKHTFKYFFPVGNVSTLSAEIIFIRHSQSFQLMYIYPPIIFFLLSLTSFSLRDNIGTRMTIPIGVLTQLIIQWVGIYNKLPPVTTVTRFDEWMLGNIIAVAIVLMTNAFICYCKIEQKKKQEERKEEKTMETLTGRRESQTIKKETTPSKEQEEPGHSSQLQDTDKTKVSQSRSVSEKTPLKRNPSVSYSTAEDTVSLLKDASERAGEHNSNKVSIEDEHAGGNDKKELKQDFKNLLDNNPAITIHTEWEAAIQIIQDDPRYQRVKHYNDTSKWYKEHILKKRKTEFCSLLAEKTSIFNCWERAKNKIDHDARFLLLDEKGRKQCYTFYRWKRVFTEWYSAKICVLFFVVYISFVLSFCLHSWVQKA